MPIDLKREELLTFAELAGSLPCRRRGRPVHPSTIFRWRAIGVRGVRLEAIRIGGAWMTSWDAFERFCEQLTSAAEDGVSMGPATARRQREQQAAEASLKQTNW